jgi:hypothetical protein
MSVITNKISVAKPVIVGSIDAPLDARTRCNNEADFPNIETPFVGMLIFTTDDNKYWVVTKLKSKLIGNQMIENYQIDQYVPLGDVLGVPGAEGDFVSQETFEKTVGDINSILDDINGEVL